MLFIYNKICIGLTTKVCTVYFWIFFLIKKSIWHQKIVWSFLSKNSITVDSLESHEFVFPQKNGAWVQTRVEYRSCYGFFQDFLAWWRLKGHALLTLLAIHTSLDSFYKWTKISSLEIYIFGFQNNGERWSWIYFEIHQASSEIPANLPGQFSPNGHWATATLKGARRIPKLKF